MSMQLTNAKRSAPSNTLSAKSFFSVEKSLGSNKNDAASFFPPASTPTIQAKCTECEAEDRHAESTQEESASSIAQRKEKPDDSLTNEPISSVQRTVSSIEKSTEDSAVSGSSVQTKLTVGSPDDPLEREADSVAEQVVQRVDQSSSLPVSDRREIDNTGAEQSVVGKLQPNVARKRLSNSIRPKRKTPARILRSTTNLPMGPGRENSLEATLSSTKGSGRPLPTATRADMESGFGANFENVRIHDDSRAASMSHSIQARAFTHGSDIYFNRNQLDTHSRDGRLLLAHELTHTLQQGASQKTDRDSVDVQSDLMPSLIQRALIDDIARTYLSGDEITDFLVGIVAGIAEWFSQIVSAVVDLFRAAFDGNIAAILGIIGVIGAIILAVAFPEIVLPVLAGLGVIIGAGALTYELYRVFLAVGLSPYEKGKSFGKAIIEAILLVISVLEVIRFVKAYTAVARVAAGASLIEQLRAVKSLMRYGDIVKTLEVLAEVGDLNRTLEILELTKEVDTALELIGLAKNTEELVEILRNAKVGDLVQLRRLLASTKLSGSGDLRRLLELGKLGNANELESLLSLSKVESGQQLFELLQNAKVQSAQELLELLRNPKVANAKQLSTLIEGTQNTIELSRQLNVVDSGEQLLRFQAGIADASEIERLVTIGGSGNTGVSSATKLERVLSELGPGKHPVATIEAKMRLTDGVRMVKPADQAGEGLRIIRHAVLDGKIRRLLANGVRASFKGKLDFVILMDGRIVIGHGHSVLSDGAETVRFAGGLTFNSSGVLTEVSNWSGHYPSSGLTSMAIQHLGKRGIDISKAVVNELSF